MIKPSDNDYILVEPKNGPRKDGKGQWSGLAVEIMYMGQKYTKLLFPDQTNSVNPENAIQFSNVVTKR